MSFKQAVNHSNTYTASNMGYTQNGAPTLKSTKNPILDFFFMAGALRGKHFNEYRAQFDAAFSHDERLTMQLVLWLRDVRGGAGERETTRKILSHMEEHYKDAALKMIPVLAEFGRWDDLLVFTDADCKALAYNTIAQALRSGNALCAKWMPRIYKMKKVQVDKVLKNNDHALQGTFAKPKTVKVKVVDKNSVANKNRKHNNQIARELMSVMNLTERQYRKLLSSLTQVVENKMCDDKWDEINYEHVPSVASARYVKAFKRHDEEGYEEYLTKLSTGEAKVNASSIFPYDVLKNVVQRYSPPTAEQVKLGISQWDALPNFLEGAKVLPMVDTSGSMSCSAGSTDMSCMFVAVSLGLYIADKQDGIFKDLWLNFSHSPQLIELKGKNIAQKAYDLYTNYTSRQYWDGSTNISAAFDKVLSTAKNNNLAPEDMPEKLIVLSDMEFNNGNSSWGKTPYLQAKAKFEAAGYKLPHIVFWNLNARPGNNPVSSTDSGVSLVSGFSSNLLKPILSGKSVDPVQTMLETIDSERYRVFC